MQSYLLLEEYKQGLLLFFMGYDLGGSLVKEVR